jgi:hypothetical protein
MARSDNKAYKRWHQAMKLQKMCLEVQVNDL